MGAGHWPWAGCGCGARRGGGLAWPSGSMTDRHTRLLLAWETGLGQLVRGGCSVTSSSAPCPPDSTLKPRNTCSSLALGPAPGGHPWGLQPLGAGAGGAIWRPGVGRWVRPGAGRGPLCLLAGLWVGKANARGPAPPCLPHTPWCRARSEAFTPHQAPPSQHAPGHSVSSPCLSVHIPQTESTTIPIGRARGLAPQTL